MDNMFAVSISNGVGNLPQQTQPLVHRQLLARALHKLIETLGIGFRPEKEDGAKVAIGRRISSQNAWVIEDFQDLELTSGRVPENDAFLLASLSGDLIDASESTSGSVGDVMGLPVLIGTCGAFKNQAIENEITHAPLSLPRTNARLLHRLGEPTD